MGNTEPSSKEAMIVLILTSMSNPGVVFSLADFVFYKRSGVEDSKIPR